MTERITNNAVRLADKTVWHVDGASVDIEGDEQAAIEYILRYGSPEQVLKVRLDAAEIIGSYTALLFRTERHRSSIVSEIKRAFTGATKRVSRWGGSQRT